MNKITYLFGAGASANALPIVEKIPERISSVIQTISSFLLSSDTIYTEFKTYIPNIGNKRKYQYELIETLKWMRDKSANHASIDTFAKKLSIKGASEELRKLKIAMSVFFTIEQALNKPDMRYDAFFASILEDVDSFPNNIKIISWNYDYQFELAFSEYIDVTSINTNQYQLGIDAKYRAAGGTNASNCRIFKLNGTTGFYQKGTNHRFLYSEKKSSMDIKLVDEVTRNYVMSTYIKGFTPTLSFAWENDNHEESIVKRAIKDITDTKVLVVIGYSFPFFNRNVDQEIINSMESLEKVYFQAPDAEILKERFQALRDNTRIKPELVTLFDTKQFLLPNEL